MLKQVGIGISFGMTAKGDVFITGVLSRMFSQHVGS